MQPLALCFNFRFVDDSGNSGNGGGVGGAGCGFSGSTLKLFSKAVGGVSVSPEARRRLRPLRRVTGLCVLVLGLGSGSGSPGSLMPSISLAHCGSGSGGCDGCTRTPALVLDGIGFSVLYMLEPAVDGFLRLRDCEPVVL